MKKIACGIPIFFLIISCLLYIANKSYDFPEEKIFNYMEYNGSAKMILNLNDYVIANFGGKQLSAYNKNSKNSFIIAETAFDEQKRNMFFITAFDNTVIYISKDTETSGSAIYAFDIDTYKKKKLSSYNSIVNLKAFLGMQDILGIEQPASDFAMMFAAKGDRLIHHNKIIEPQDLWETISKSSNADDFSIPNSITKTATTKEYIFFLSSFNELLRFDYATNEIKCLSETKIKDFFIDDSHIYFTAVKNSYMLCYADYNMENLQKLGNINIECIRCKQGIIYLADTEKNIWYINSDQNLISTDKKISSLNSWDTDGEYIYVCDFTNKVILSEKLNP